MHRFYRSAVMIALTTGAASAQSINIDFGDAKGTPSAAFPGLGLAGVWNTSPATVNQAIPLVGLDGALSGVTMTIEAPGVGFNSNNFGETGDLQAYVGDRMFTVNTFALRFDGLADSPYEVFVVVANRMPSDPSGPFPTSIWLDDRTAETQVVSGTWSGAFEVGESHAFFSHQVVGGSVVVNLDKFGDAVLSGVQLVQIPAPSALAPLAIVGAIGCCSRRRAVQ